MKPTILPISTFKYIFDRVVSILGSDQEYARVALSVLFQMNYLTCRLYNGLSANPISYKEEYFSTQKQIEQFSMQDVDITPFSPLFFSCHLLNVYRNISVIDIREYGLLTPEFHEYHNWLLSVMGEASRLFAEHLNNNQ